MRPCFKLDPSGDVFGMEELSWDWADILGGVTHPPRRTKVLKSRQENGSQRIPVAESPVCVCVCSILKEGREAGADLRNGC